MGAILTITLNPAIDVSTSVDQLLPSVKLRCAPERRDAGGGGVNVARVAHRLGARVLAAHTSGGIVGKLLERLLAEENVPNLVLPVSGETREDITIFETATGREYRFILPGPNLSGEDWEKCLVRLRALEPSFDLVVLSGSLPPGAPANAYASIASAAKATGARVVVDASGKALSAALEEGVFLTKPNLEELRALVGAPLPDEQSWVEASRRLIEARSAEIVVLSLGSRGALLATKDEVWRAEPAPVEVVSSIGAGDSFVGAMIWALDAGLPLRECFRYGVAGGSAALLASGTQLCTRHDVERLLPRVVLRRI
jgi:6-phosphofructokinase 2